jgi:hypothetical protein
MHHILDIVASKRDREVIEQAVADMSPSVKCEIDMQISPMEMPDSFYIKISVRHVSAIADIYVRFKDIWYIVPSAVFTFDPNVTFYKAAPHVKQPRELISVRPVVSSFSNTTKTQSERPDPPKERPRLPVYNTPISQEDQLRLEQSEIDEVHRVMQASVDYEFQQMGIKPFDPMGLLVCLRCRIRDPIMVCKNEDCARVCYCMTCYDEVQQSPVKNVCYHCRESNGFVSIEE